MSSLNPLAGFIKEYRYTERKTNKADQQRVIVELPNLENRIVETIDVSENGFYLKMPKGTHDLVEDQNLNVSFIRNSQKREMVAIIRRVDEFGIGVELFDNDIFDLMETYLLESFIEESFDE